ncbi:MAG: hypothetical protein LUE27_00010, partial [Clostridia bacterium]|nr:hypothetical protein [Clostridia bacterium]
SLTNSIKTAVLAANVYADDAAKGVADALSEDIATAQDAADAANASIEDLKDAYAAADKKLQEQIDELSESLTALSELIDAANSQIQTNQDAVVEALLKCAKSSDLDDALKTIADLKETLGWTSYALNELSEYVTGLALEDVIDSYLTAADIKDFITMADVQGALVDGDYATNGSVTALQSVLETELQTTLVEAKEYVDTQLGVLNGLIGDIESTGASTILDLIAGQGNDITDLQNSVNYLLSIAETKRLKSMVYVPSTYVHGVACINFLTLRYTSWTNVEADPGDIENDENCGQYGGTAIAIDDENHTEDYFVNPSNVTLSSISDLSFVSNEAKETRVSGSAPISIVEGSPEIVTEDGVTVLRVTLQNNMGDQLGDMDESSFTIVSLKATIADDYLTEEEKADGDEVAVYSDWARVSQTTDPIFIHFNDARDNAGYIDEDHTQKVYSSIASDYVMDHDAHFWNFSQVYGGAPGNVNKETQLSTSYNTIHIAAEALYSEDYDLMQLVTGCNGTGTEYTPEELKAYGLTFKFDMDGLDTYYLQDETDVDNEHYTNQQKFAYVKEVEGEDGKVKYYLVPTSIDGKGTEYNASAIGREPLVRVELIDNNNVDANGNPLIVDVRYFKIKWVKEITEPDYHVYSQTLPYEANFSCAGISSRLVRMTLNDVYSELDISQEAFRNTYKLYDAGLFPTAEAAETGTTADVDATLGTLTAITNSNSGQTDNIEWTINPTSLTSGSDPIVSVYNLGGTVTVSGYVLYYTGSIEEDGTITGSRLVIPVEMTLTVPTFDVAENVSYTTGQWGYDSDGNPLYVLVSSIYSSASYASGDVSEFSANLLSSDFLVNGAAPTSVKELVGIYYNGDQSTTESVPSASFIFVDGNGFYASQDGSELYADEDLTELAATLTPDGQIELATDANDYGTDGAKALLASDNGATVQLVASDCIGENILVKQFNVHFKEPLTLSKSGGTVATITDGNASTYDVDLSTTTNTHYIITTSSTTDCASSDMVSTQQTSYKSVDTNCAAFYGVGSPAFESDLSEAIWEFSDGSILSNADANTAGYYLTDDDGDGKYTYSNTNQTQLLQSVTVTIPVTITSYWQTFSYNLTIKITPQSEN